MPSSLRSAWLAFLITALLVMFVAGMAYSSARDRLADAFAQQQHQTSLSTARHLRSKYDIVGLCLRQLGHDLGDGKPKAMRSWFELAELLLDQAAIAVVRADDQDRIAEAWPREAEQVPPEVLTAALATSRRSGRPAPLFYAAADGGSRMLVASARPAREGGRIGIVLDPRAILAPALANPEVPVDTLLVEPETLAVVAGTRPLGSQRRLDQLFSTPSEGIFAAVRSAEAAWEREAKSLSYGSPGEPYLLGTQGVRLGEVTRVVVAVAPRRTMVEGYLTRVVMWIALVGGVMLVALVSFVVMVIQTQAAAEQERQRSEERSSLLKISHALLSERRLHEVLGRIADEARELFRAEGATIALVDEETDEIVFRCVSSRRPEVAASLEGMRLPRHQGVLGWVVDTGEGVLVHDASKDERFSESVDEKTGGQTMSLLCAPLRDQRGVSFGAIELVNNLENPFPASDLTLLQSLGAIASAAAERALLLEREAQQQRLQREIEIARTVQDGLLPHSFPQIPGFDMHGATRPAREVGGDFFDFIPVSPQHLGVVIADVADKGLGAAMFMVMCRSLLYACANRELSPAKVLQDLNRRLTQFSTSSGLFVTTFYGVLDLTSRRLTFSNAGHNPPYWYSSSNGSSRGITVPGMALGVLDEVELGEASIDLRPGDRLVLYTDGVTEAINEQELQFGKERLQEVLANTTEADAEGTVQALLGSVESFVDGQDQFDDITLAVIRVGETVRSREDWLLDARDRG